MYQKAKCPVIGRLLQTLGISPAENKTVKKISEHRIAAREL